jgi:hypothetical protein
MRWIGKSAPGEQRGPPSSTVDSGFGVTRHDGTHGVQLALDTLRDVPRVHFYLLAAEVLSVPPEREHGLRAGLSPPTDAGLYA